MLRTFRAVAVVGCLLATTRHAVGAELTPLKIQVGNLERTALAHFPEIVPPDGSAVVFIFHGHGGSSQNAAKGFAIHDHWPEAICVYMQGVPTTSPRDPQGTRSGWQRVEGEGGDRDLKFFDDLLARIRKNHKVDDRRIYATGFSNGGAFTYALWAARGNVVAAVAPCGASAGANLSSLKPKPCLHLAGQNDKIAAFDKQKATMDAVRVLNGCAETGEHWNKGTKVVATLYPSQSGTPFVSIIHPGGHILPKPAGALITRFFKEHAKP